MFPFWRLSCTDLCLSTFAGQLQYLCELKQQKQSFVLERLTGQQRAGRMSFDESIYLSCAGSSPSLYFQVSCWR